MNSALPAAAPDGLTRLNYLHGAWTGHGEFRDDHANLHYFAQTETVTPWLDGELLTIEGIGHDRDDTTRATHLAFAIVRYDIGRRNYPWRAYSGGNWIDTELLLSPNGFRWSLQVEPRQILRYTATVADDVWDEVGQISHDGAPWSTIMTMRLHRQRTAAATVRGKP